MPIKDDDHLNPITMQHIVILRLKAQVKKTLIYYQLHGIPQLIFVFADERQ